MFLDRGWPPVTETVESETVDKGELSYVKFFSGVYTARGFAPVKVSADGEFQL